MAKKRGRPAKPHLASWGEYIDGLYRVPGQAGLWRITATGQRFTEHDERQAVAKFRQLTSPGVIRITAPVERKIVALGQRQSASLVAMNKFVEALQEKRAAPEVELRGDEATLTYLLDSDVAWGWFASQIRTRKQYVAQRTGYEQIAYLEEVEKPQPSPTFEEVGTLYFTERYPKEKWPQGKKPNWLAKAEIAWREFREVVGVNTLRELTQDLINHYEKHVDRQQRAGGYSPTYKRQRFEIVKSIIRYPKKRGKWAQDSDRAYAFCGVLVKPSASPADPKPIEPTAFTKLLAASNAQMYAMLLVALNACMYADPAGREHRRRSGEVEQETSAL